MAGSGDLKRLARGLSEVAFRQRYGAEEQCRDALFAMRWGRGWRCVGCGHERYAALKQRAVLQCNRCKRQVSLTAGTIFHSTKLPLTRVCGAKKADSNRAVKSGRYETS